MSLLAQRSGGGFSSKAMIIAVLVGVVAFAGIGVLSAYGPELKSGDDGREHALSRSSVGFGALPVLLRRLGVPVIMNRGSLSGQADDSLMVLTLDALTDPRKAADIQHAGSMLIILPKWRTAPHPNHPGWVQTVGVMSPAASLAPLPAPLRRHRARLTARPGAETVALRRPNGEPIGVPIQVDGLRTLSGADWIPVVVDDRNQPVLVYHAELRTYVLSDPDLVNTSSLKTLAGAQTAIDLIDVILPEGSPIVFDLTLHGLERTPNLLRLMLEPPLLGLTLVLVGLAAFVGVQALVRFGPPRKAERAIALGKRGLADNTAALIRLARREHHMAAPYARLVRARVARAIGAPRNLEGADLDNFLDRISATVGAADTYSALARQAAAARTGGDLMRVAAALHRWNQELTRAR
jgi:hypothetical protein